MNGHFSRRMGCWTLLLLSVWAVAAIFYYCTMRYPYPTPLTVAWSDSEGFGYRLGAGKPQVLDLVVRSKGGATYGADFPKFVSGVKRFAYWSKDDSRLCVIEGKKRTWYSIKIDEPYGVEGLQWMGDDVVLNLMQNADYKTAKAMRFNLKTKGLTPIERARSIRSKEGTEDCALLTDQNTFEIYSGGKLLFTYPAPKEDIRSWDYDFTNHLICVGDKNKVLTRYSNGKTLTTQLCSTNQMNLQLVEGKDIVLVNISNMSSFGGILQAYNTQTGEYLGDVAWTNVWFNLPFLVGEDAQRAIKLVRAQPQADSKP